MKRLLFILIFIFCTSIINAQSNQTAKANTILSKGIYLDNLFPINHIIGITVTNEYHGKFTLTKEEVDLYKILLKTAKYQGGLRTKLGHIYITFQYDSSILNKTKNFIYNTGSREINFDNRVDKYGNKFSGSFSIRAGRYITDKYFK